MLGIILHEEIPAYAGMTPSASLRRFSAYEDCRVGPSGPPRKDGWGRCVLARARWVACVVYAFPGGSLGTSVRMDVQSFALHRPHPTVRRVLSS